MAMAIAAARSSSGGMGGLSLYGTSTRDHHSATRVAGILATEPETLVVSLVAGQLVSLVERSEATETVA